MGFFGERRKSSLPEAYTGVNRPPTSTDMPNEDALAAAHTIGKLFQGKTGSSVNMNQNPLMRSNSMSSKLDRNYNHQLKNLTAASSINSFTPAPPKPNSRPPSRSSSFRGPTSSQGSFTKNVKPPKKKISTMSLPLDNSSPLNSLTSANSTISYQRKITRKKKSAASITSSNTRFNEASSQPRMVKKTVPTANGLVTIEVPAEEAVPRSPSVNRTSSLMSASKQYIPRHSSFTVSSINQKHKLQHSRSRDDSELSNYLHDFSENSFLQAPPAITNYHNTNKARKRVSFTEDSANTSLISGSIAEYPDDDRHEEPVLNSPTSPLQFVTNENDIPQTEVLVESPTISSVIDEKPEILADESEIKKEEESKSNLVPTEPSEEELIDEKTIEEEESTTIKNEQLYESESTIEKHFPNEAVKPEEEHFAYEAGKAEEGQQQPIEPMIKTEENPIEATPTIKIEDPVKSLAVTSKSSDSDSKSDILQNLTPETTTSITPPETKPITKAVVTQPQIRQVASPPLQRTPSKARPQSLQPQSRSHSVLKNGSPVIQRTNEGIPSRSPSRIKNKRNSNPINIPSAHAFEQKDALSGYSNGNGRKKINRQSLPANHNLNRSQTFDPLHPSHNQGNLSRGASGHLSRSSSAMAQRSFRKTLGSAEVPQEGFGKYHNGPVRSQSVMGNRSFRDNINTPPPQFEAPPNHIRQRPRSEVGFRSSPNPNINKATVLPDLGTKSSYEKLRPAENNIAFKRLSMRDTPGSPPSNLSSPQPNHQSNGGFSLFNSRFEDSDDEDSGVGNSLRFSKHTLRGNENNHSTLSRVQESPHVDHESHSKLFGFARNHKPETPTLVKRSAVPDIVVPQAASTMTPKKNYNLEADTLKTPNSSINSDILFEKHLNESKKHFMLNQSYSAHHAKKTTKSKGDEGHGTEEEPKKKKRGKLRKLFGI